MCTVPEQLQSRSTAVLGLSPSKAVGADEKKKKKKKKGHGEGRGGQRRSKEQNLPLGSALNPEASACSVCFVLKGPLPTTRFPAAAHCPKGEGLEGRRLVVVVAYACDRSESPSNGDGEHGWCRRGGGVEVSERPGGVTESPYGPKPHQKRKKPNTSCFRPNDDDKDEK